jgi:N-acetylglutamate synthase-like GNAT family acetyltransferase
MLVTITEEAPDHPDALRLMNELSDILENITGDNGRSHFSLQDINKPRSLFVIARNQAGEAIGCGALRPVDEATGEIKRMYANKQSQGIGTKILSYLENRARELNYKILRLETRLVNRTAVSFYESRGYHHIPNYGVYVNRPESVCFEKRLADLKQKPRLLP